MNSYDIGQVLFFYLIYSYGLYYYSIINKKNRDLVKKHNKKLNKFRDKAVKSIKEQKAFLNAKNPYRPFKFRFMMIFNIIFGIFRFIVLFTLFRIAINYLNIKISLFFAIISWFIWSYVSSYILMKYNLENNDLLYIMRWKK